MPTVKHRKLHPLAKKSKTMKSKKSHKKSSVATHQQISGSFEKEYEKSLQTSLTKANDKIQMQLIKELKTPYIPSKITPQTDFYTYINYRWIKDTNHKPGMGYLTQIDDFRLVQHNVYNELINLIKQYISNTDSESANVLAMYNMYKSASTNISEYQMQGYATVYNDWIQTYFDSSQPNALWKMMGELNKNEIVSFALPFQWALVPDPKQSHIYRSTIMQPKLSLVDINVYFDDGTQIDYKKKYRVEFNKYVKDLFTLCLGKDLVTNFNPQDIFDVELELLDAMGCIAMNDSDSMLQEYARITPIEAIKKYNFDFSSLCEGIGYKNVPDFFTTSNTNYLYCGATLCVEKWKTPKWQNYWRYIYFRQLSRFSVEGLKLHFNFYGTYMTGQQEMMNKDLQMIYPFGYAYNKFLTNQYIANYSNDLRESYVRALSEDLRQVFVRIIKRNKWLQPATKKKALIKLNNLKLIVGSPKIVDEDPVLTYSVDDIWENLTKVCNWRTKKFISLEGTIVDTTFPLIDWSVTPPKFIGTQAYVVNASYTPSQNAIYIPLGYIQPPFIDLSQRGVEYNLAHIGFTLAHEMSHSLDDWGSQYDENGNLNDWWLPKDRRYFEGIQKDIIKQYETYASYDNIKFDADIGIGEDMADISGLNICCEYLRDFQDNNKDILPIRALSFDIFFVYFAFQMRQKISEGAMVAQLKTNPHPLDKYRTNVPLSRMPLYTSMYNIQKKDKMYWKKSNISRIWE